MVDLKKLLWGVALVGVGGLTYKHRESLSTWLHDRRVRAKLLWHLQQDQEMASATSTKAQRAHIRGGKEAIELLARACEVFGERTFLISRSETEVEQPLTFQELWKRVEALAGAMHEELGLRPGDRVAILGFSSADWLVTDMACLYLGAVSVPIDHQVSQEQLDHLLGKTQTSCLFCSKNQLPRLNFAKELCVISMDCESSRIRDLEELDLRVQPYYPTDSKASYSIVYTSGSTGHPKGVELAYDRWTKTLLDGVGTKSVPRIDLGYLPLAHMAGRITIYKALMSGGRIYLSGKSGMVDFLSDLTWARPTHLLAVPRVSQFLYQQFRMSSLNGREFHHKVLGGRLYFVHTGAAPTGPQVTSFMRKTLGLQVTDVYGSTEMGPVAVNGRICPGVSYKIISRPEIGFTTSDRPYPRGELAIKSPRATVGYYNDPGATNDLKDDSGFLLSGDIVEERAPGRIAWVGRRKGVLRLGHGEYVQVSRLEELFSAESTLIRQIYLHGQADRDALLAVVVPEEQFQGEEEQLLEEIRRIAHELQLKPYEIPRGVLLEREEFSVENGLLSGAQKPLRLRFSEIFGTRLDALYQQMDKRRIDDRTATLEDVVARTLGLANAPANKSFQELGGDSLAAAEVSHSLWKLGLGEFSAGLFLDSNLKLADIAKRRIDSARSFDKVHGNDLVLSPETLEPLITKRGPLKGVAKPRKFFLTGASGFLGRHLCLELLRVLPSDGELICLVRGKKERLLDSFRDPKMRETFEHLAKGRLRVLVGELSHPQLGLGDEDYKQVCHNVESIIHAGALVNHALPYRDLYESNVVGTTNMIDLACCGIPKSIHFVSSAGLRPEAERSEAENAGDLWKVRSLEQKGYAQGYLTSKWASEILVDRFHQNTTLPISIYRCGLLLPGTEFPSEINPGDVFSRLFFSLLRVGLAPHSFYEEPYPYQAISVEVAAKFMATMAVENNTGRNLIHLIPKGGPTLDQMLQWVETEHSLQRLPYSEFYREFVKALEKLEPHEREKSLQSIVEHWKRPIKSTRAHDSSEKFLNQAHNLGLEVNPEINREHFLQVLKELQ